MTEWNVPNSFPRSERQHLTPSHHMNKRLNAFVQLLVQSKVQLSFGRDKALPELFLAI